MATQRDLPNIPRTASATVAAFRLITPAGAHCGESAVVDWAGVSQEAGVSGDILTLRSTKAGTCKVTIAEAVGANVILYKDADGKVGLTNTNARFGYSLEAGSGDGSIIEALPD